MTTKTKKQTYYKPYKEFKRCSCGRPYFYLEFLKKCPGCGRKLIFYGDLVNQVILQYYSPHPIHCAVSLIEKIIILGRMRKGETFELIKEMIFKEEEKYSQDIIAFLKIFLKELDKRYRIIKKKEKSNKLSKKDPFENLIIKRINFNHCLDAYYRFFDSFPVKSIPKEQLLNKLQKSSLTWREISEYERKMILYSLDHSIEETARKFETIRGRINTFNRVVLLELFKDTTEYKEYEKLEEKLKKAEEEYTKAAERYYKSIKEKAKKINRSID